MTSNGQILSDSSFAFYIDLVLKSNPIKNIVEIGTWKGLGSTKRIIDSIIQNNISCNFISIESNKTFYNLSKENLKDYTRYVDLTYGRIVTLQDINNYLQINPIKTSEQQNWLQEDIVNMMQCPVVINKIPSTIDFLLLDGGEFSTYAEWKFLWDRSHIIALDDTKTMKAEIVKQEILSDTNNTYEIIVDSDDRNGFMFIKNKYYVA